MAAANVQPVPWVLAVAMRGTDSSSIRAPSKNTSTASPSRWPPFTTTAPRAHPLQVARGVAHLVQGADGPSQQGRGLGQVRA